MIIAYICGIDKLLRQQCGPAGPSAFHASATDLVELTFAVSEQLSTCGRSMRWWW